MLFLCCLYCLYFWRYWGICPFFFFCNAAFGTQNIPFEFLSWKLTKTENMVRFKGALRLDFEEKLKTSPFFLYFLLNDTWIHLFSDNMFFTLIYSCTAKNSRFWRPASNPIVLARFIPPKWFKNSFYLILRPLSPAPDFLVKNFHHYEARLQKYSIFTDRKCASILLTGLLVRKSC